MFKRPRIHSLGVHGVDHVQLKYVPKSNALEIVLACDDGMVSEFTLYVYGDGAMPIVTSDWIHPDPAMPTDDKLAEMDEELADMFAAVDPPAREPSAIEQILNREYSDMADGE